MDKCPAEIVTSDQIFVACANGEPTERLRSVLSETRNSKCLELAHKKRQLCAVTTTVLNKPSFSLNDFLDLQPILQHMYAKKHIPGSSNFLSLKDWMLNHRKNDIEYLILSKRIFDTQRNEAVAKLSNSHIDQMCGKKTTKTKQSTQKTKITAQDMANIMRLMAVPNTSIPVADRRHIANCIYVSPSAQKLASDQKYAHIITFCAPGNNTCTYKLCYDLMELKQTLDSSPNKSKVKNPAYQMMQSKNIDAEALGIQSYFSKSQIDTIYINANLLKNLDESGSSLSRKPGVRFLADVVKPFVFQTAKSWLPRSFHWLLNQTDRVLDYIFSSARMQLVLSMVFIILKLTVCLAYMYMTGNLKMNFLSNAIKDLLHRLFNVKNMGKRTKELLDFLINVVKTLANCIGAWTNIASLVSCLNQLLGEYAYKFVFKQIINLITYILKLATTYFSGQSGVTSSIINILTNPLEIFVISNIEFEWNDMKKSLANSIDNAKEMVMELFDGTTSPQVVNLRNRLINMVLLAIAYKIPLSFIKSVVGQSKYDKIVEITNSNQNDTIGSIVVKLTQFTASVTGEIAGAIAVVSAVMQFLYDIGYNLILCNLIKLSGFGDTDVKCGCKDQIVQAIADAVRSRENTYTVTQNALSNDFTDRMTNSGNYGMTPAFSDDISSKQNELSNDFTDRMTNSGNYGMTPAVSEVYNPDQASNALNNNATNYSSKIANLLPLNEINILNPPDEFDAIRGINRTYV